MKNKIISAFVAALIFCCFPLSSQASELLDGIARITRFEGKIYHGKPDDEKLSRMPFSATNKYCLFDQDRLTTDEKSSCEVEMKSGAALKISEKTECQIMMNGLRIKRGEMWIKYSAKTVPGGKIVFKMDSPVATIGIKGTRLYLKVSQDGKELSVKVIEGVVSVSTPDGKNSADLKAGGNVIVDGKGGMDFGKTLQAGPDPFEAGNAIENKTGTGENGGQKQAVPEGGKDNEKTDQDPGNGDVKKKIQHINETDDSLINILK